MLNVSIRTWIVILASLCLGGCWLESDMPVIFEKDRETIGGLVDTWELVALGTSVSSGRTKAFVRVTALPDKEYGFESWGVDDDGFRGESRDLLAEMTGIATKQIAYLETGSSTYLLLISGNQVEVNFLEVAVTRSYNPLRFREIETVTFSLLDLEGSESEGIEPALTTILQRWGFSAERRGSEKNTYYGLTGNLTSSGLKDLFSDAAFDKYLEKTPLFSFKRLSEDAFVGVERPTENATAQDGAAVAASISEDKDEYTKQLEEKNRQLQQQLEAQQQAEQKLQEQLEATRREEVGRQQMEELQRICGAWTCVKLADGTVLFRTQDGTAWIHTDGKLAPRNIWPKR